MKKSPMNAVSVGKPSDRGQAFLNIGDTTTKTDRLTEVSSPHGTSETEREQTSFILGQFPLANPGIRESLERGLGDSLPALFLLCFP